MKNRWIDVDKRLPDNRKCVLAFDGKILYICRYVAYHQEQTEMEDYDDHDESYSKDIENDVDRQVLWLRPGFWETIEQHNSDYEFIDIHRQITHWQPLPLKPQEYESQRLTEGNQHGGPESAHP